MDDIQALFDTEIIKIKEQHYKLCQEIERYNIAYFELNDPLVEDAVYDAKYQELVEFEQKYIKYLDITSSPTQSIGGKPALHLTSVRHKNPMLSLANAWDSQDVEKFYSKVSAIRHLNDKNDVLICEPKLDGLAVSIVYINGILKYGVTRGNGYEGENITDNLTYVVNLPQKLLGKNIAHRLEVRGEIIMKTSDLLEYNKEALLKNEKPFSNSRNAAAGTLRQIHKNHNQQRKLYVYAYGLEDSVNRTHLEDLNYLTTLGFPIIEHLAKASCLEDLLVYYEQLNSKSLDYQIDGVVYKLNVLSHRQLLGYTNKSPRWAIAYKFRDQSYQSTIIDIYFQIGRTGVITPVALIQPVTLDGVTINRVTLHNIKNIIDNHVTIGTKIQIERSGGVIPYIKSFYDQKYEQDLLLPKACIFCGSSLEESSVNLVCLNGWLCKGQVIARLDHMFSKNAFNVRGLGRNILELLVMQNIVAFPKDILLLSQERLLVLQGFSKKKSANLVQAIHNSKKINLSNFIYSLGVIGLGLATAKLVALKFKSLKNLLSSKQQDLQDIPCIGPQIANNIYVFFQDHDNQKIINDILDAGVNIVE